MAARKIAAVAQCEYRGAEHLAVRCAAELIDLFPCATDDSAEASIAGDASTALRPGVTPIRVAAADVVFRPPLLPRTGAALVSGFMRTHHVNAADDVPAQPNWFFKGFGSASAVGDGPLRVPATFEALCEEIEVVLVYVIDPTGAPVYVGYTFGNDLTDIGHFKRLPGHLAYAKLCQPAILPWLFREPPPAEVTGTVTIERDGAPAWQGAFRTGADALHYRVDDLVSTLFGYPELTRPGTVHYLYLGADKGSYQAGFRLDRGDRIIARIEGYGLELSNTIGM
ncbi:hypothetical protein [Nocardia jiangxiensis]|uniref:2-keto-4-pentenoate hydratase/2-oxohepta-3-ene-1,7-dioic acid hydratase (Catechol pathway) n=1 Tax=Nocardia jiangxiensis TaxID=282685 RepID=A0ABW6S7C9_9NOCA|nr:hypothetical protein [Nocardia jiangxiensis]